MRIQARRCRQEPPGRRLGLAHPAAAALTEARPPPSALEVPEWGSALTGLLGSVGTPAALAHLDPLVLSPPRMVPYENSRAQPALMGLCLKALLTSVVLILLLSSGRGGSCGGLSAGGASGHILLPPLLRRLLAARESCGHKESSPRSPQHPA